MLKEILLQVVRFAMFIFRIFPLQNKVVFSSFAGRNYSDSPRYIFNTLKKRSRCRKIWLMNDDRIVIDGADVIAKNSIPAMYHLATAKVWVDNSRKPRWVSKRKNQFYIQTWHSGLGLKKVERDVETTLDRSYVQSAKNDASMTDLMISNSRWLTEWYHRSFWYNGPVLECGLPREDVFKTNIAETRTKVDKYFDIESYEKIVLYVPTFRDDGDIKCYDINYEEVLVSLERKFGGKWKFVVKLHPNIAMKQDIIKYSDDILNGTNYEDINELIVRADVVISDYSSCIFDAINIERIVFLYVNDIDKYLKDRGINFCFEELPFSIARNGYEFIANIESFNKEKYLMTINSFKQKYGVICKGDASEIVVKIICQKLEV